MDWIFGDFPLDQQQMENNAQLVASYFLSKGWTLNAIAGMLGNMQAESTINPGRWEDGHSGNIDYGFGLVQWTPAETLIMWCVETGREYIDGTAQCDRIDYELRTGVQYYPTSNFPETFKQFSASMKPPDYLASAFLYNYERPDDPSATEEFRRQKALEWYKYLGGISPGSTGMPWIYWMRRKQYY